MNKKEFFILLIIIFIIPVFSYAKVYIDINSPTIKKFTIAIPNADNNENIKDKINISDILSNDLNISGLFNVININMDKGDNVDFNSWLNTGAEALVKSNYYINEGDVKVEFRLLDLYLGNLITGSRYEGDIKSLRKMVHMFSNEIIKSLTGEEGIFDTKISFVSNIRGNKEIYIMDFDGYNPQPLTSNKSINLSPRWSKDSSNIAYISYKSGKPLLYIMDIKNKKETIIKNRGVVNSVSFSPKKDLIAIGMSINGNSDIYIMGNNGEDIKRLTHGFSIDVSPSWSPDGRNIAFVSDRSGSPQVYIMDLNGENVRRLTFKGNYNTSPSWSPKGDKILFTSMTNNYSEIYSINIDGSNLFKVIGDRGNCESPSWSPDGRNIAFSSNMDGKYNIYIINSDGSNINRITNNMGDATNPYWSSKNLF